MYFTVQICALVAAVVKTQILISSHGGFSACANLESSIRVQRDVDILE